MQASKPNTPHSLERSKTNFKVKDNQLSLQIPGNVATTPEPQALMTPLELLWERVKMFYGSCLCFLLILVAFTGIANQWCVLATPAPVTFLLLFLALILLAYIEALHYACVAVEKWDMHKFEKSHTRAFKCWQLVDTPQKVKKFLVGRQFFVIFVVFLIAQITSFPLIPENFIGMPPIMTTILVQTGLPGLAIVLTFGQLVSQIYVEEFTLEFLNLYGCEFVIRLCNAAEWIGICNFSWFLYHASSFICCKKVQVIENEIKTNKSWENIIENGPDDAQSQPPMSPTEKNRGKDYKSVTAFDDLNPQTFFQMFKYLWSTFATIGSLVIIFYGISIKSYVLPTPVAATYIVFFLVMSLLFYLEGLMIAIVATQYWDKETWKEVYPRAYMTHELINRPDNVKRFIIGRQFCTVLTGFLLAQITTFHYWSGEGFDEIGFFIIVKSGLVGVMVVLAFGQLCPELLAQEYPLRFMNLPGSYSVCYASLFFDGVGVGHAAWTFYYATRAVFCKSLYAARLNGECIEEQKPTIIRVDSAEVFAASPSSLKEYRDRIAEEKSHPSKK